MILNREFAFIIGIPVLIITEIIRYIKAKPPKRDFVDYKEINIVIFSMYIMALISVALLPIYTFGKVEASANVVPVFNTVKDIEGVASAPSNMKVYMIIFWIINIFGNLFLLVPLAAITPIIFKRFRTLKSVILLCATVSILIELIQYLSQFVGNIRSVDIDDVILNSLGSIIGFSIFKIINRKLKLSD